MPSLVSVVNTSLCILRMCFKKEEISGGKGLRISQFIIHAFYVITFYLDWLRLGSLQFSWPSQYTCMHEYGYNPIPIQYFC